MNKEEKILEILNNTKKTGKTEQKAQRKKPQPPLLPPPPQASACPRDNKNCQSQSLSLNLGEIYNSIKLS